MSRNSSSIHLNAIFQALWLPQDRVKDVYDSNLLVVGHSPFNLIKLDELLLEYDLYEWSMEKYIQSKLNEELFEHFFILFL